MSYNCFDSIFNQLIPHTQIYMFDDLFLLIAYYGYAIVVVFLGLKFYLLLWYKPRSISFALKNLLFLQPRVSRSTREMDNPKFPFFKRAYTQVSIAIFLALVIWLVLFIIITINTHLRLTYT